MRRPDSLFVMAACNVEFLLENRERLQELYGTGELEPGELEFYQLVRVFAL